MGGDGGSTVQKINNQNNNYLIQRQVDKTKHYQQ